MQEQMGQELWAVPSLLQKSFLLKTRSGIRHQDCLLCGGPRGAVFLLKTFSFQSCQTRPFHQHNWYYDHRATLLLRWWCRQLNTTPLCPNQLILVNRIQKSHYRNGALEVAYLVHAYLCAQTEQPKETFCISSTVPYCNKVEFNPSLASSQRNACLSHAAKTGKRSSPDDGRSLLGSHHPSEEVLELRHSFSFPSFTTNTFFNLQWISTDKLYTSHKPYIKVCYFSHSIKNYRETKHFAKFWLKKKKALPFSAVSVVEMLRALRAASKSCTCFNNRCPLSGSTWMFTVANVFCKTTTTETKSWMCFTKLSAKRRTIKESRV